MFFLVLPDRIELSTSPLPRECSTTELRQHLALTAALVPQGRQAFKPRRRRVSLTAAPGSGRTLNSGRMQGMTDKPRSAKDGARKAREARLAAALRANLRRRKDAARDSTESAAAPGGERDAAAPPAGKTSR